MEKSISNSQGYVYFNKQRNKWNACYPVYDCAKGKDIIKTKSFSNESEANDFLKMLMYQRENPIYIKNYGIPFCEMMKANAKLKLDTNQVSEITYFRTLQTIAQIEKYPIGKKNIDQITSDELQVFINQHKHLSNSTINKLYQQLNSTFVNAINKGYMMKNPMINVLKPKSNKLDKKVRALTVDEQQLFTEYLLNKELSNCRYKNVYLIQMFMGLRISEALALKLHDIDLQNKRIHIDKTLTKDETGRVIMGKTTKTYAGTRYVPIPDFLMSSIMEQMRKAEMQPTNTERLLFKPEYRQYTDRENVNTELKRLLKRHFGIEDITTHSLRHTFGTRCIESGMAPVVVQKLMGHTDIGITLNTYTSVFDKFKEKEIDKVNKYYLEENLLNATRLLQLNSNEIDEMEIDED